MPFTYSSSFSTSVREKFADAGTRIAFTIPFAFTASAMSGTPPPSCFFTRSVRTTCGMSKRRSGLSLPYFAIDSSNGMRRNGRGSSTPSTSFHSLTMSPSITSNTSFCSTNDISTSIWVNSGCRSSRRSSSRKQRTIWKYRSNPATM